MQTVKIKHKINEFAIINESDFNPKEDELLEAKIDNIPVKRKQKQMSEPSLSDSPLPD